MARPTGLSFEQLETAFRHRNFKPLYFFYGEEGFLAGELQRTLIATALEAHERDFNLDIVYGADVDAAALMALCASYPVMAQRRVVIVRDFEKVRENRLLTSYAAQPNPTAVVLLVCNGKPNLSAHPYRALREHAAWAEFKPLYENQIPGWIQSRVQSLGHEIEPKAVQMLAEFVGSDLRAAVGEVEKLITFAGGRRRLLADDVVRASGQTREHNVFELQKAIGEGRMHDALRIADRMVQQASSPRGEALMIVSVLNGYFTKLWKLLVCKQKRVPEASMAARIGVPPFFIKEYLFSLNRFGPRAIEHAFGALLAADFELKGGAARDERLVLTLMLRRLSPEVG